MTTEPALRLAPVIRKFWPPWWCHWLPPVRLSGSGATCFGLFNNPSAVAEAPLRSISKGGGSGNPAAHECAMRRRDEMDTHGRLRNLMPGPIGRCAVSAEDGNRRIGGGHRYCGFKVDVDRMAASANARKGEPCIAGNELSQPIDG